MQTLLLKWCLKTVCWPSLRTGETFLSFTRLPCLANPYLSYNASVICPTCPNARRLCIRGGWIHQVSGCPSQRRAQKTTQPSRCERAKKTTPRSRPHLFPLRTFQLWLQETEEKRLTRVFFGRLNSSLLRSHSCSHFHNCGLSIRQKQDGSTSLHRKRGLCSGPQGLAVTGQNAMYMTDIKNRWNKTIGIWLQSTEGNTHILL